MNDILPNILPENQLNDDNLSLSMSQEAHIALAFQGASWTSEYSFPLMVMQTLLGSWDRASAAGRNIGSK